MVSDSAGQASTSDNNDARQKNIAKLEELLSEGQKKLLFKDADSAVDVLSEAARLADVIYGALSPDTFNAYIRYGRALVHWASEQYAVFKTQDVAESSDEEDEQSSADDGEEETEQVTSNENVTNGSNHETNKNDSENETNKKDPENEEPNGEPAVEEDVTRSPDEPMDEFDSILSDAWSVLEVAKKVCEEQLNTVTEEVDIRKWKLNLSEPLYYLGQVLILSDQPEKANIEFRKSLEIKQQFLSADDRDLAATLYNIAKTIEEMRKYEDAKVYYEQALTCLKNKIASFESTKTEAAEIEELQEICKDLQEKIDDMTESAKSAAAVKEVEQKEGVSTAPTSSEIPVNDASSLVKRRRLENSDDLEAKKPKTE